MSLASVKVFKGMTSAELSQLERGSLILEPRDGAAVCARVIRPTPSTPSPPATDMSASAPSTATARR